MQAIRSLHFTCHFTIIEIDNKNSNEGDVYVTDGNHINNNLQNNVFNSRRYNFNNVYDLFMTSDMWKIGIVELIKHVYTT